jgi:hypothetical protein
MAIMLLDRNMSWLHLSGQALMYSSGKPRDTIAES